MGTVTVTYCVMSLPQLAHMPRNCTLCVHGSSISATCKLCLESALDLVVSRGGCLLRASNDGALANHPSLEDAFDVGFESGREALLDLILITQVITFCHGGLIEVREQRCEPLDIVVWLLQQLRDGDWVMKALWESQQHAGL